MPAYNTKQYNANRYNVNVLELLLSESASLADLTVENLATILTLDNLALSDNLTKSVINKGLFETLRMSAWLTIKRKPAQSNWSD